MVHGIKVYVVRIVTSWAVSVEAGSGGQAVVGREDSCGTVNTRERLHHVVRLEQYLFLLASPSHHQQGTSMN